MRIRLGDIEVAYAHAGTGDPVVMVHGLAEDGASWAGVQARLDGFASYAYDLRGHGATGLGEAQGTLAQLGGDLIRFLEGVTGPAACVGYSLGGTVVLWVAAERPDLVRRAVVIGTSTVVGRTAAGFFRTGDMACLDADGYVRITGRLKDMIIRGGVNISPVPIEDALASHPNVAAAAVIGAPDERLGERICAVIVAAGPVPGLDELNAYLKARGLPKYYCPDSLRLVDAMPMTPAGKIRKNDLRAMLFPAHEGGAA